MNMPFTGGARAMRPVQGRYRRGLPAACRAHPYVRLNETQTQGRGHAMSLITTLRDWQARRRTYAELARLSDRELHDAGIPRWRLADIARGGPIDPRQVI